MKKIYLFFYVMGMFAIGIISISKYKGLLEILPNKVFWVLYIPMVVLVIAIPFAAKHESKSSK